MDSPFSPLPPKQHSYDSEIPYSYHGDKGSKLYAENEYLKERVQSCEKGLCRLYQLLTPKEEPPRVLTHYRSASLTMRAARSNSHTSPSPIPESQPRSGKEEPTNRVVTFAELKEAIMKLVTERDQLAEKLEDHRQITEAAKRERLLAIDEKDILLKESHELKTALERVANKLKEVDRERKELTNQVRDLERDINILRRTNEESMRLRSIAIEERSKLIDEYSQLQNELTSLQNERSNLLDEILQLQSTISQLTNENRAKSQRKLSNHGYIPDTKRSRTKNEGGIRVKLMRMTPGQPWGFSVDGGRGSEFYRGDPSIVVSVVKENTPSHGVLFSGDRLMSIAGRDLRNVTRKEALDVIRSCDQVIVDLVINRTATVLKPISKEVKIPGKKTFGFSYETRVFVTGVESLSSADGLLSSGDEITQVMGKSTLNMKPSVLKQLLKNCKDGVTMTIQPPTGVVTMGNGSPTKKSLRYSSDSAHSLGVQCGPRFSGEGGHTHYQTPGTPGSSVSETSAGYHSLTHSMPSIVSNALSPITMETKPGQTGLDPVGLDTPLSQPQLMTYPEEDSETSDSGTPPSNTRYRPGCVSAMGGRQRPTNCYTPRRATLGHIPPYGTQSTHRTRTTSQSSYGPGQTGLVSPRGITAYHSPLTPGAETTPTFSNLRMKGTSLPRGLHPSGHALSQGHTPHYDHFPSYQERRKQVISMSADNLDSDSLSEPHPAPTHRPRISRTMSQGNHMMRTSFHDVSHANHVTRTPSRDCHMMPAHSVPRRRPISMSMGSMTNV